MSSSKGKERASDSSASGDDVMFGDVSSESSEYDGGSEPSDTGR